MSGFYLCIYVVAITHIVSLDEAESVGHEYSNRPNQRRGITSASLLITRFNSRRLECKWHPYPSLKLYLMFHSETAALILTQTTDTSCSGAAQMGIQGAA